MAPKTGSVTTMRVHGPGIFLALAFVASASVQSQIKRATHPAISPNGESVVFSYQNDLWIVQTAGGEARRLTIHPASESMPRWLPDGKQIAFVSNRYGSNDLFIMDSSGLNLRRVNGDPSTEYLHSVSPDGKWLLGYTTAWGRINTFAVPTSGGDIVRMTEHPLELTFFPTLSPDGQKVAFNLGGSPGSWRNPGENGSDTSEIWVASLGFPLTQYTQITKNNDNDIFPQFLPSGEIVFVSNRSGSPQVWRMSGNGGNPKKLTDYKGGTVRFLTVGGGKVAYEYDSEIHVLDLASGNSREVKISVPADEVVNPIQRFSLNTGASSFVVSPDGKRGVVAVRGDLFLIPARGGTTRRLTQHAAMDADPVWLDNNRVLFVTGRNALRELMSVDITGKESLFLSGAKDLTNPQLSPDSKWVAYHYGDMEIQVVSAAGGTPKKVASGAFPGTFAGGPSFSWSPDSEWVTYEAITERGSEIHLASLEGKLERVARVPRGAGRPLMSADGKNLFFNVEDGDAVGVYRLPLVPDLQTFSEDDLDKIDEEKPKESTDNKVKIDTRGIERRLTRIAAEASLVAVAPDGKSVWVSSGGAINSVPVRGGQGTPLAGVTSVGSVQFQGGKAHITSGGRASSVTLTNGQVAPVGFNAEFVVNRKDEELELFKEIWWAMNRMYYDPKMHGLNWNSIRDEYAKLVPYCYDRSDFYALMNEMIEELNSSHLSIGGPPSDVRLESESVGWLGAEWDWNALASRGIYRVASVLPDSPADLSDSLLKAGDVIETVDGKAVNSSNPITDTLVGKIGRRVNLGVRRGGVLTQISIKPTSPAVASSLRYEEYVAARRAEVERLSNGRFTYFHIQGMNEPSLQRFYREMRVYGEGKKGAIVDVRWNGGGNTANRVLAALRTDKWLERRFRSMPNTTISEELFRGEAAEMPVALMTNQYSASNAEILSEGFRRMKLGPIVGEPTGGNVLTVAGRYPLWDGGGVQIPFIGIFTIDGESLEGPGRKVDVDVRYDPNFWLKGRDNQLEAAVAALEKRVRS